MMGGVSWGVCTDALFGMDGLTGWLFLFYVAFTILAVMNIITGVFVDNAVEAARGQRDFLIQKEMELREKCIREMRVLFAEMDQDGRGHICLEDVNAYLQDPRVQGFFTALGLDTSDTKRLFKLIDDDGSGDVDANEFLEGCLRLKGEAKSIDVCAILHHLKLVEHKLDEWYAFTKEPALGPSRESWKATVEPPGSGQSGEPWKLTDEPAMPQAFPRLYAFLEGQDRQKRDASNNPNTSICDFALGMPARPPSH